MEIRNQRQVKSMSFVARLQPFMLTQQRVAPPGAPRYTPLSTSTAPRKVAAPPVAADTQAAYYAPGGRDPLFWCFHIGRGELPGIDDPRERGYQLEQTLKVEGVERIRAASGSTTPAALKRLQELESELTSRAFTRGNGLCALADGYKTRLLYVSGKTCCFMGPTQGSVSMIIRRIGSRNSRRHEVYKGDALEKMVDAYTSSLWLMESWQKPLRAVSAYTSGALKDMAMRAGLAVLTEDGKKMTKVAVHGALRAASVQN